MANSLSRRPICGEYTKSIFIDLCIAKRKNISEKATFFLKNMDFYRNTAYERDLCLELRGP